MKNVKVVQAAKRFIWYSFLLLFTSCNLPKIQTPSSVEINKKPEIQQPSTDDNWIMSIGGEGRDYAPSFCVTDDGFVVVGMTSSYGLGNGGGNLDGSHDFLAIKINNSGEVIWSITIGGADDERGSYSVQQTSDQGFLLTGTTKSFGAGRTDIFIVKLKGNGVFEWSKVIGGTGGEGGMTTLETVNGFITVGDTDSYGAGKKDLLVVKLNSDGEIDWAKAYGGIEDDVGSGISAVNDGYILGGTIWSFGAGEADSGLLKIDHNGDVIWGKTVGGLRGEGINWDGVRVTSDGGYAFGDKTTSFGAKGNGALFGVKLTPHGELVWSTMVDGPGEDVGWTMNETGDGYIAGGKLTIPEKGGDVLIVKFDRNGKFLWSRIFGGAGLDEIEEIKPVGNGYVMAGVTRMIDPAGDFLFAKINFDGYIGSDADPITSLDPRSVLSISPIVSDFSPKVTDVSSLLSINNVNPTVMSPSLQIHDIGR